MIRTSVCLAGSRCGQLLGRHEAGLHLLAGSAPRELHIAGVHPATSAGVSVAALRDAQLSLQSAQAAKRPQAQVARLAHVPGRLRQTATAKVLARHVFSWLIFSVKQISLVRC